MAEASDAGRPQPQEFERVLAKAATAVASFDEERLPLSKKAQRFLHAYPTVVPFVVLVLGLLLGCAVNYSHFVTGSNLSTVLTQVTIVGFLGVAQTLVILTAGIDLSVGVIMVISSVVMGRLAVVDGLWLVIAFPLGLLCGIAFGALNGWLVTRLEMPPFIVTLGTLSIIGALNTFYSQSETIRSQDLEAQAPFLQSMGIPIDIYGSRIILGSFLLILLAIAVWYMLNRTAYGKHIYATGDDPEAARLAGINTNNILLSVYVLAGLISSIAGWVLIGRIGAISPTAGENANLDSITAVVIGGTSLFGGRGSIVGTLVGALIVGVFRSAVSLAGLDVLWQEFAIGVLIIVAVALDQWIRRVVEVSVKPILQARSLVKKYGRVTAMDHADFDLYPGEILAVIGDNGAGKSSLIKALCGAVIPDSGEIRLADQVIHFRSPIDAREAGIETVYQNLALSPALSIADNMFLGREIKSTGAIGKFFHALDRGAMQKFARDKLNELGLMTIQNINQPVETLSGGQRQGVAVARAAAFAKKVVIMDEPTAALGVKESRRVLELILDVKKRGLPIILISHNMPHVFEVADRIHIHRLGRRLTVIDPKKQTMSDAVAMMTGAMPPPAEMAA